MASLAGMRVGNPGDSTVYYSVTVRHAITASSQKMYHNQVHRQPVIAIRSTYTIIAGVISNTVAHPPHAVNNTSRSHQQSCTAHPTAFALECHVSAEFRPTVAHLADDKEAGQWSPGDVTLHFHRQYYILYL